MPQDSAPKRAFDVGAKTMREAAEKGTEAVEQATKTAERNYSSAAEGLYSFNSKLMEMAQANMTAAFGLFGDLALAKEPTEAFEVWSRHLKNGLQRLSEQSHEITTLGHRVESASSGPLSQKLDQAIKRAP